MTRIFLSYRREDSSHQTGRIFDKLEAHFGADQVFKDVDSIPLGIDFRRVLSESVAKCDVLLCVIGDHWLTAAGPAGRRLDSEGDFVRTEVEAALSRNIPVVPVLVGTAPVPKPEDLPEVLRPLAYRNAIQVRADPDFRRDVERLIRGIEQIAAGRPTTRAAPFAPRPSRRVGRRTVVIAAAGIALLAGLTGLVAAVQSYFGPRIDIPDAKPGEVYAITVTELRTEQRVETVTVYVEKVVPVTDGSGETRNRVEKVPVQEQHMVPVDVPYQYQVISDEKPEVRVTRTAGVTRYLVSTISQGRRRDWISVEAPVIRTQPPPVFVPAPPAPAEDDTKRTAPPPT